MRCFFSISYKGTRYHGWQAQPNANTVQAEINTALGIIIREPIETTGSGRTDAGVHARIQVFHADIPDHLEPESLIPKLNGVLPDDIVVQNIRRVTPDAHARFDATRRVYEYHLQFNRSPFGKEEAFLINKKPDLELMNKACEMMIGEHDFASFSKVKTDVTHFKCTIFNAHWQQNNTGAVFTVEANRFLRGMVRAMVGTLLNLGLGKIALHEFEGILHKKNRDAAGQSVPAQGLYLCEVRYPETIFLK